MVHNDNVILVNENDEEIGTMDKIEAHRGQGQLHRAISVYLFRVSKNGKVQLLIQKRSAEKIVGQHLWANTACGNVRPGESYEDCAFRRLGFELGIQDVNINPIYKFRYQVKCNEEFSENEIDQVFFGWYSGEVNPNPQEVSDYKWVDWTAIDNLERDILAPWFIIMLDDNELIEQITQLVQAEAHLN